MHKTYAIPADEWIKKIANELEVDAVGLWQIIPVGRHDFGLEGGDLYDFIRLSIINIIDQGGEPVRMISGKNEWQPIRNYGQSAIEIADAVLKEWKQNGEIDPSIGDTIWFYKF